MYVRPEMKNKSARRNQKLVDACETKEWMVVKEEPVEVVVEVPSVESKEEVPEEPKKKKKV